MPQPSFCVTILRPPPPGGLPEFVSDIFTEISFTTPTDLMAFLPTPGETLQVEGTPSAPQTFKVSKVDIQKGIRPPPRGVEGAGNFRPFIHATIHLE